jgi:hypothetical protein
MPRPLKPTGVEREYLRECIDVLSDDPPTLRWRARPLAHFDGNEASFKTWNKNNAGQEIRPQADGRMRVTFTGGRERRSLDARSIIAEIGVTPIGGLQGVQEGTPNDRLAETRALAGGGPLAAVIQAAMLETGRSMDDLTVMSGAADPYRTDTPARRRDAQWFAEQVERFVAPDKRIHPRGVFYACVSAGDVVKPDGEPFENTAENEPFIGAASRYARWLGYVPFDRLVDAKNDAPIVRDVPTREAPTAHVWPDDFKIEELDPMSLGVSAGLAYFEPRQPYRLAFFGEKTSLEDVLGPLSVEYGADLYLMSGQISDTHLHGMARDAASDGRPLAVFTFSDFDPAGYWDMPTCIGRKLQALRDLLFPSLRFTVVHAALGPEQMRGLELPSSPLKEGERRAAKWFELYGSEQTEIDALATLQPADLERIAREAVAPFFDAELAARVQAAEEAWNARVSAEIEAQVDQDRLDTLKARAETALEELLEVNAYLADMAAEIEISEPPDLPEADMDALEQAQAERRDSVLIDSDMGFVEAVDSLKAHNELAVRRETRVRRR